MALNYDPQELQAALHRIFATSTSNAASDVAPPGSAEFPGYQNPKKKRTVEGLTYDPHTRDFQGQSEPNGIRFKWKGKGEPKDDDFREVNRKRQIADMTSPVRMLPNGGVNRLFPSGKSYDMRSYADLDEIEATWKQDQKHWDARTRSSMRGVGEDIPPKGSGLYDDIVGTGVGAGAGAGAGGLYDDIVRDAAPKQKRYADVWNPYRGEMDKVEIQGNSISKEELAEVSEFWKQEEAGRGVRNRQKHDGRTLNEAHSARLGSIVQRMASEGADQGLIEWVVTDYKREHGTRKLVFPSGRTYDFAPGMMTRENVMRAYEKDRQFWDEPTRKRLGNATQMAWDVYEVSSGDATPEQLKRKLYMELHGKPGLPGDDVVEMGGGWHFNKTVGAAFPPAGGTMFTYDSATGTNRPSKKEAAEIRSFHHQYQQAASRYTPWNPGNVQGFVPGAGTIYTVTFTGPDGSKKAKQFDHKPNKGEIAAAGQALFSARLNMTSKQLAGQEPQDKLTGALQSVFGSVVKVPYGKTSAEYAGQRPALSYNITTSRVGDVAKAGLPSPLRSMVSRTESLDDLPDVEGASSPVHDELRQKKGTLEEAMARADLANKGSHEWKRGGRAAFKERLVAYQRGDMGGTANLVKAARGQMSFYDAYVADAHGLHTKQMESDEVGQLRQAGHKGASEAILTLSDLNPMTASIPKEVKRPIVNTGLALVDPFVYRDMFEMVASDPVKFTEEVVHGYATLFDSDATVEERVQSALNWALTIVPALPKAAGMVKGKFGNVDAKRIAAANAKAAEIIAEHPEAVAAFQIGDHPPQVRAGYEKLASHEQTLAEYRASHVEQMRAHAEAELESLRQEIPHIDKRTGRRLGHTINKRRQELREYSISDEFLSESAKKHKAAVELAQNRGAKIGADVLESNALLTPKSTPKPPTETTKPQTLVDTLKDVGGAIANNLRDSLRDAAEKTGKLPDQEKGSTIGKLYEGLIQRGAPRNGATLDEALILHDAINPPNGSAAQLAPKAEPNMRSKIKDRANQARERLKNYDPTGKSGPVNTASGFDPELLADYAAIAADYMIDVAGDLAKTTKHLIDEYGLNPKKARAVVAKALELPAEQRLEAHFREGLEGGKLGYTAQSGIDILKTEFPGIDPTRRKHLVSNAKAAVNQPIAMKTTSNGEQVPIIRRGVEVPQALIDEAANQWADVPLQPLLSELRIVQRVGKGSERLHDYLITERAESVTRMTDERAQWKTRLLREIPFRVKDKTASKLTMQYGEGRITFEELQRQRPNDWQKIIEADRWFRENYNALLDRWNAVRRQYGFSEVPKRKDYYTHIREEGLKARLLGKDSPIKQGGVVSESVRADKGFNPYELPRDGELPFKDDAVKAFEGYLNPVLRDIHLTESAIRRRALADALRENPVTNATVPEFIQSLESHADALIGRKQAMDRATGPATFGKHVTARINASLDWLVHQQAKNRIVGNVGSVIMQTTQLAPAVAETGMWRLSRAFAEEAAATLHAIPEAKTISPFLRRRYADTSTVRPTMGQVAAEGLSYPLEAVEETVTNAVWRSAYHKAKDSGLKGSKAIEYADELTEKIVAGRSIGEEPIAFQHRLGRVLGQFQLEVNNAWHHYWKELRFTTTGDKKLGVHEQAWKYAKYTAALYGLNSFYDWATGRTPLPDPVRMGEDIYKIANGHDSMRVTRADTTKEKVVRIGGRIMGEFLSAAPGGAVVADVAIPDYTKVAGVGMRREDFLGRTEAGIYAGGIPISSSIKALWKDPAMFAATTFMPMGGSQILRSARGVNTLYEGGVRNAAYDEEKHGSYGDGSLAQLFRDQVGYASGRKTGKGATTSKYAYTIDSLPDKVRLILFGPKATSGGRQLEEQENSRGSQADGR